MHISTFMGNQSSLLNAYLEHDTTIVVKLADSLTSPFETSDVIITEATTGRIIPALNVALPQTYATDTAGDVQHVLAAPGEQRSTVPTSVQTDLVEVMLAEAPDVTHSLHIALNAYIAVNSAGLLTHFNGEN